MPTFGTKSTWRAQDGRGWWNAMIRPVSQTRRTGSSALKGTNPKRTACVLTSLESTRTFIWYGPQRTPLSGDTNYRRIETGRKRSLHNYWYVWDPIMGPM